MGNQKIGVALWSLGPSTTMAEYEKLLDKAAEIGVKAVQPWCVDEKKWNVVCALDPDRCVTPAQRTAVRKAAERRGLVISAFCCQLAGPKTFGGFGEEDANHEVRLEKTRRALRFAVDAGSPINTTHIGPIPDDRESKVYVRMLKSVISIMKDAEKHGGILACETGEESAATLKQFIEDVGSPNLKVNFDPANMIDRDPVKSVHTLKDYIVHTHAKDKHPETGKPTVGQGGVPWKDYLAALREIGYQGWYALEDESGDVDVSESVKFGKEFLEKNL